MKLNLFTAVALVLAFVISIIAIGFSQGTAYKLLEDLAQEKHTQRTIEGSLSIGAGIGFGLLFGTASAFSLTPEGASMGVTLGVLTFGAFAVPGTFELLIPSNAENKFNKISAEPVSAREKDSALALEELAYQGRVNRYIWAVLNAAAGTSSFFLGWPYLTVIGYGFSLFDLLVPSPEESKLATYYKLTKQPST